jgi:hypothetical protein
MDERAVRDHIHRHADAVVDGDMATVLADFSAELQPRAPELAKLLPQPVTTADVESLDVGDDEATAVIRYSGDSSTLAIRSRWQEHDGAFQIVAGEPLGG